MASKADADSRVEESLVIRQGGEPQPRSAEGWTRRYRLSASRERLAGAGASPLPGESSPEQESQRAWNRWMKWLRGWRDVAVGGGLSVPSPQSPFTRHVRHHLPATLRHGLARWLTDVSAEILHRACPVWQPALLLPELEGIEWLGGSQNRIELLERRGERLRWLLDREWPGWARCSGEAELLQSSPREADLEIAWRASCCALEWVPSESRAALCAYALALMPGASLMRDDQAEPLPKPKRLGTPTRMAMAWIEARQGRWSHALAVLPAADPAGEGDLSVCVLTWLVARMACDEPRADAAASALEGLVWPADPQWQAWLDLGEHWKLSLPGSLPGPHALRALQLYGAFAT